MLERSAHQLAPLHWHCKVEMTEPAIPKGDGPRGRRLLLLFSFGLQYGARAPPNRTVMAIFASGERPQPPLRWGIWRIAHSMTPHSIAKENHDGVCIEFRVGKRSRATFYRYACPNCSVSPLMMMPVY
eukprot:576790-Rhodomonas_salina.1